MLLPDLQISHGMAAPPEVNATEPSDELIYIKKLSLPSVLLKHQADAVNDVGRARYVLTILDAASHASALSG
jgi:hypothetical protein